nr:DUF3107 domain-containing protein [Microbacterium ginsengiterrae]
MTSTVSAAADTTDRRGGGHRFVRPRRNRCARPIRAVAPGVESSQSPILQGARVEIRIGIINTGRELNFETSTAAEEIRGQVASALEQNAAQVSFTDVKGNTYIVPTANLAYIELGTEESRRVGFVA